MMPFKDIKIGAYKLTACGNFPPNFTKPLGKVTACGPVGKSAKSTVSNVAYFLHFPAEYFYATVLMLFL